MFKLLKNIDVQVHIYPTPFLHHKRWGFEWSGKMSSNCPFGRYEKNRWCKTGFRLYYGSRKQHITVSWADSFYWCPIQQGACRR